MELWDCGLLNFHQRKNHYAPADIWSFDLHAVCIKAVPIEAKFSFTVTRDKLRPLNNQFFIGLGKSDRAVFMRNNGLESELFIDIKGLKRVDGLRNVHGAHQT